MRNIITSVLLTCGAASFAITDTTFMLYDSSEVQIIDSLDVELYEMLDSIFGNLSMTEVSSRMPQSWW